MNTSSPYSQIASYTESPILSPEPEDPLNNTIQYSADDSSQMSDGMKDTSHGRIYLEQSFGDDGILDDDGHYDESEKPETKMNWGRWLKEKLLPECSTKVFVGTMVLYVLTFLMVALRSVDFVLYIRMATMMTNYEFILSGLLLSFAFNLISWPIVLFHTFATGKITKKMWKFPKIHFAVMGTLDCINNVMSTFVAPYLSGSINVTLGQSVILHNMVCSFIFLKARYTIFHMAGIVLVAIGIIVDVIPLFLNSGSGENKIPVEVAAIFVLIGILSYVPMSLSNVYKENYLKKADLDEWYVNAWVAFFQLTFGVLLFPTVFIPNPVSPTPKIQEFWKFFVNGCKCVAGINSITIQNSPDPASIDRCDGVWAIFSIFICFNITFNLLLLTTMKRGSSTLAMVASSGRLAMSNILFLVPFIAGIATAKSLSVYDIVALIILILGIAIYGLTREKIAGDNDIFVRLNQAILPWFFKKKKTKSITYDSIQANNDYLEDQYSKKKMKADYDTMNHINDDY